MLETSVLRDSVLTEAGADDIITKVVGTRVEEAESGEAAD